MATIELRSYHGSTPDAGTDVGAATIAFKLADNDTVDALDAVRIPSAGTARSWAKNLRLHAVTAPANQVSNIRFYTDGSSALGTGLSLKVQASASYLNPIGNGTTALLGGTDAFGYTSGAPLAVTGVLTNPATGAFGHYIQVQLEVSPLASSGTTGIETLTIAYDEV